MRCATCVLTSEEGASLALEALLDRLEICDECPIALGQEACPAVALERLLQGCRASSRALRKLGNKARKAEREVQEMREATADYEERAAKLEALQQASTREADRELRRLQRAPCTGLEALGVRYLALHAAGPTCGGRLLARDGAVSVYELTSP